MVERDIIVDLPSDLRGEAAQILLDKVAALESSP